MGEWVRVCAFLYTYLCVCEVWCCTVGFAVCVSLRLKKIANTPQHWDEGWRISYGGKGVFSVILMAAMLWLPESPRWLVAQDRDEEVCVWVGGLYFYIWWGGWGLVHGAWIV